MPIEKGGEQADPGLEVSTGLYSPSNSATFSLSRFKFSSKSASA